MNCCAQRCSHNCSQIALPTTSTRSSILFHHSPEDGPNCAKTNDNTRRTDTRNTSTPTIVGASQKHDLRRTRNLLGSASFCWNSPLRAERQGSRNIEDARAGTRACGCATVKTATGLAAPYFSRCGAAAVLRRRRASSWVVAGSQNVAACDT